MEEELDIVVIGWDVDPKRAQAGLARVFGLQARKAELLLHGLPAVAKRSVPRSQADRYVKALRSIGAQVQLERSAASRMTPSAAPAKSASLPPPAVDIGTRQTLESERAAAEMVARFRAAEGLDVEEPPTAEALNPLIPRAPALPHDLSRMPNASTGLLSGPPPDGDGNRDPSMRPRHTDAQLPPPLRLDAPASGELPAEVAAPEWGLGEPMPSQRSVGLAHTATASVRPGVSAASQWATTRPAPRRRWLWPVAVAIVLCLLVAAFYLRH
ncbi:MAG: hypothetical protein ACHQ53_11910 [Polyangiales bacterium]